jgi:ATP-dependent DNA ligase
MFSTPKLGGTEMYVELFWPEGASRLGGLLNAGADKAIQYQAEHGPVRAFIWDIVRYKGKSVKGLPYAERRALIEKVAEEIKPFCPLISAIPKCPDGMDPVVWYQKIVSDPRGLPWSEGIVLKPKGRSDLSYKIKDRDTVDCKVLEYVEGEGKYEGTLGKIVVQPMDKRKGHGIGEVGSLQLTDEQRDWVWANKDLLINEVAEISAQGRGPTGAILKGVFKRFHPGKSEAALLMYAEGSGSEDPRSAVFAMKTARGWKGGR